MPYYPHSAPIKYLYLLRSLSVSIYVLYRRNLLLQLRNYNQKTPDLLWMEGVVSLASRPSFLLA
uniref:Uncharacterized protein n=1 Tax=Picea glauca TaxID=3330 RepID=A0A101LX40_PICGL|nr:hypothetical protein ABT39_MTgene5981 [Picea glauca]QHR88502.1 hypothetical protein Q903MT_gene2516 [Picea sitchensis]